MSNTAQIDENKLRSILDEVEAELGKLAKSDLAKARPGEATESEDKSDSSTTDPAGDNTSAASASPDAASASPDASGSDDSGPPDASASPAGDDGSAPPPAADDGSGAPDASASPDASADPAADQGPIDPQALMAEYSKLSPEDQKLHYMCLKQVLMQTLAGAGADAGSAAGAPPPDASAAGAPPPAASAPAAGPPAAASPPPDASAPAPALKAESGMSNDPKANGDLSKVKGGESLSKSEVDAAINAAVAPLIKAVKHVLEAPLRKSVQFKADAPVAAPTVDVTQMSREQVRAQLREKLQTGTLSKSDKDLMIQYDMGKVKVDQIAHLLK
jgi:hypothetical protein